MPGPSKERRTPLRMKSQATSLDRAPRAVRTPISRVRSEARLATMPRTPRAESSTPLSPPRASASRRSVGPVFEGPPGGLQYQLAELQLGDARDGLAVLQSGLEED